MRKDQILVTSVFILSVSLASDVQSEESSGSSFRESRVVANNSALIGRDPRGEVGTHLDSPELTGTGLAGTVTAEATGAQEGIAVSAYDTGGFFVGFGVTSADGTYEISLGPGTYFVTAQSAGFLVGQLYDGLLCIGGPSAAGCDPTTGTPVVVVDGSVTGGIDFSLPAGGKFTGTVTEATTGFVAGDFPPIHVYDLNGDYLGDLLFGLNTVTRNYVTDALPPAQYFAIGAPVGFVPELYSEIPCPALACDPTTGSAFTIIEDVTTGNIDFTVDIDPAFGAIAGVVTAEPPHTISYGRSRVWTPGGRSAGVSAHIGEYVVGGLPAGDYFVTADTQATDFAGELFDDLPCDNGELPGCDVTVGTPVEVVTSAVTSGIDFELQQALVFTDGFESGNTSAWSSTVGG